MLIIVIFWAYISCLFLIYGIGTLKLFQLLFKLEKHSISPFFTVSVGIVALMFVSSSWHLLIPVDFIAHVFVLLLGTIMGWFLRKDLILFWQNTRKNIGSIPLILKIVGVLVILFLSFLATDAPLYNLDEGRYHLQNLNLSKNSAIIPGIVNLHDRFASNSSWYTLNAIFDNGLLDKRVFHVVNPLLITYLVVYSLLGFFKFLRKEITIDSIGRTILLFYLIVFFYFWRYWYMIGVTPDLAVQFFVITGMLYYLKKLSGEESSFLREEIPLLFLLFCGAFLSRSTGIVGLLILFPLVKAFTNKKELFYILKAGAVIVTLPVLLIFTRNAIMSGYILFPSTGIDILNVDWKFPSMYADRLSLYASNHQLFEYLGERKPYSGFMDFNRLTDLFSMFKFKSILSYNELSILLISMPLLVLLTIGSFIKKNWDVLLILVSALIITFFGFTLSGGVYRYGSGYMMYSIIIPIALIVFKLIKNWTPNKWLLRSAILFFIALFALKIIIPFSGISLRENGIMYAPKLLVSVGKNSISLNPVPETPTRELTVNDVTIRVSEYTPILEARNQFWYSEINDSCLQESFIHYRWYTTCEEYNSVVATMNWMNDEPCVGGIYIGLESRGDSYKDGFRLNLDEQLYLE